MKSRPSKSLQAFMAVSLLISGGLSGFILPAMAQDGGAFPYQPIVLTPLTPEMPFNMMAVDGNKTEAPAPKTSAKPAAPVKPAQKKPVSPAAAQAAQKAQAEKAARGQALQKTMTAGSQPSLDFTAPAAPAVQPGFTSVSSMDAPPEPALRETPATGFRTVSDQPAVHTHRQAVDRVKYGMMDAVSNKVREKAGFQQVSYAPLPAVVVFPVIKHGQEKAFGDLPIMFSREFSQKLELKVPEGTKVYHPVYTVDELRLRGLGHVYDKIMAYYLKAGRPEPTALDYMLHQLSPDGHSIARVIFVEADLDMNRMASPTSAYDRLNALLTDAVPTRMRYHVRSRVQVFDAEQPEFPMVWAWSWDRAVKADKMTSVMPSVFTDGASEQAFARVSREMSREMMVLLPRKVYMQPQFDTSVRGKLVGSGTAAAEETPTDAQALSPENRQAIDRILQHQPMPNP